MATLHQLPRSAAVQMELREKDQREEREAREREKQRLGHRYKEPSAGERLEAQKRWVGRNHFGLNFNFTGFEDPKLSEEHLMMNPRVDWMGVQEGRNFLFFCVLQEKFHTVV